MSRASLPRLVVVDYGMGNLGSVANALRFLGAPVEVAGDPQGLPAADGYVLPGVGAFGVAMRNLRERGWVEALEREVVRQRKPLLGICLGMQLLAQASLEMGRHEGLGWIAGHVVPFPPDRERRVPHVGWNEVSLPSGEPLFRRLDAQSCFYFDHSYHLVCDRSLVLSWCRYGRDFIAAIRQDHIVATQFHPEKSQRSGLIFLRNFLDFCVARPGPA